MIKDSLEDTIAAISTPVGQGGIGIVRLSGKRALRIADSIFIAKDGLSPSGYRTYTVHYGWIAASKRKARFSSVRDRGKRKLSSDSWPDREIVDEVILTVMRSPKSYTKEDIVEIGCHGGIVVLKEILDLALSKGARLAHPGEFTKRAFLNGRIDLAQAEAVLDRVNAKTGLSLRSGVKHLRGGLSREVAGVREKLLGLLVILEANINFPEEDTPGPGYDRLIILIEEALGKIDSLLNSSSRGKILREGVRAVIVGRSNVGKSSLLNALLKEERAIVTPIPGTTRDTIEEIIDLRGIPLKIADTAGIIEPRDLIEKEAIRRTNSYFEKADLVLLTFDSSQPLTKQDRELIKRSKKKKVIAVLNKCDLKPGIEEDKIRRDFPRPVKVSSIKYTGLRDLEQEIVDLVWQGGFEPSWEIVITNSRHTQSLRRAGKALRRGKASCKNNLPAELIAEDLKIARDHLAEITGEALRGEVLEKIFDEFCIGK